MGVLVTCWMEDKMRRLISETDGHITSAGYYAESLDEVHQEHRAAVALLDAASTGLNSVVSLPGVGRRSRGLLRYVYILDERVQE